MPEPQISVITAVHNGAEHLEQCLESIHSQSFEDYEHIVVDDGSSDATPAILESWRNRDSRIRVLRNRENLGRANARNRAIAVSRGRFIAVLDADDYSLPGRLAVQHDWLLEHPDVQILGGEMLVHGSGKLLRHPENNDAIRAQLFFDSGLLHSTVMMRKSILSRFKPWYDPNLTLAQDYGLWASLMHHPDAVFANLSQPLTCYRLADRPRPGYKERQFGFANIVRTRILRAIGIRPDPTVMATHLSLLYARAAPGITCRQCADHAKHLLDCNDRKPLVSREALAQRMAGALERIVQAGVERSGETE